MFNQEEIRQMLSQNPEDFMTLYRLSLAFLEDCCYGASFAMAERAIASYEKTPNTPFQSRYFELKRLHSRLLHEHLADIIGPAASLIDPRWMPIFKLGRPREMALDVPPELTDELIPALNAPQLKRLRYLNLHINGRATQAIYALTQCHFDTLRALKLSFDEMPDVRALYQFFEICRPEFTGIVSLTVQIPSIDDALALHIRAAFDTLETFELISRTRHGITERLCEAIADDPKSKALTRLALIGTSIGDKGLFTLLSSENLSTLQVLDVQDGILTNNAIRILQGIHTQSSLHSINLDFNQIDPAGIHMIKSLGISYSVAHQHRRPLTAEGD